ncbi:uncharacterized protein LOC127714620 [Mytilus californianus]|uniref:uncharacterized protein LOC127714620 n=1 Tax=Mytilus californianus TaxID=6549 RepID=UPI00224502D7|nr:uncharacterized protein LOC127714620 [Mytilus californianus]
MELYSNLLSNIFGIGLIFINSFITGADAASYCPVDAYAQSCEHGCCGNGCCVNKVSLALGLIFGLIGLILLCSGFAICFVQYLYRRKKKTATKESYAQTGDPTSGTVMKPTPIPPIFLRHKKTDAEKKKKEEVKISLDNVDEKKEDKDTKKAT